VEVRSYYWRLSDVDFKKLQHVNRFIFSALAYSFDYHCKRKCFASFLECRLDIFVLSLILLRLLGLEKPPVLKVHIPGVSDLCQRESEESPSTFASLV
jgi:hypothetical protein